MMRRCIRPYLALWLTIAAVAAARPAAAGFSYPVNDCVNTKQTQAATYCKSVLKAWAAFDKNGDAAGRDASIQSAAAKLATQWTNAEAKASTKGTDCAEATLSETQAQTLIVLQLRHPLWGKRQAIHAHAAHPSPWVRQC